MRMRTYKYRLYPSDRQARLLSDAIAASDNKHSVCYAKDSYRLDDEKQRLHLPAGAIKVRLHRPCPPGRCRVTVKMTADGKWWATIPCYTTPGAEEHAHANRAVGIDLGLHSLLTFSDGCKIEAPAFFRESEAELARVQRRWDKYKHLPEDDATRQKHARTVARVHAGIKNRRRNFARHYAKRIARHYGVIVIEQLDVKAMQGDRRLSKSIADAAWHDFTLCLADKVEDYGGKLIKVNPAGTSKRCSGCGHVQPMPLYERLYKCSACGLEMDRDTNAALNILRLGTQPRATAQR